MHFPRWAGSLFHKAACGGPQQAGAVVQAQRFRKQVLAPGTFWVRQKVRSATSSSPAAYDTLPCEFTPADVAAMCATGQEMLAAGIAIPVPLEHQEDHEALTPAEKLAHGLLFNSGWVTDFGLDPDGVLEAEISVEPDAHIARRFDCTAEELAAKLASTVRFVSPRILPSFTDGSGRKWSNAITHVALTPVPVWSGQKGFPAAGSDGAAALSRGGDGEGSAPPRLAPLSLSHATGPLLLSLADVIEFGWTSTPIAGKKQLRWKGTNEHAGQSRTQIREPGTGRGKKEGDPSVGPQRPREAPDHAVGARVPKTAQRPAPATPAREKGTAAPVKPKPAAGLADVQKAAAKATAARNVAPEAKAAALASIGAANLTPEQVAQAKQHANRALPRIKGDATAKAARVVEMAAAELKKLKVAPGNVTATARLRGFGHMLQTLGVQPADAAKRIREHPAAPPAETPQPAAPVAGVQNVIRAGLGNKAAGLSPEQREAYGKAAAAVLGRMPDGARGRLDRHLKEVVFHPDTTKLGLAAVGAAMKRPDLTPEQRQQLQQTQAAIESGDLKPGGSYQQGRLDVDGEYGYSEAMPGKHSTGEGATPQQVYAHELGHAIDGPDHELSGSEGWSKAFQDEIVFSPWNGQLAGGETEPRLSAYGGASLSEGFAEFSRLIYAADAPLEAVEREFPGASGFFKQQGLWPQQQGGGAGEIRLGEVFDKRIGLGGKADHVDALKGQTAAGAAPAPAAQPTPAPAASATPAPPVTKQAGDAAQDPQAEVPPRPAVHPAAEEHLRVLMTRPHPPRDAQQAYAIGSNDWFNRDELRKAFEHPRDAGHAVQAAFEARTTAGIAPAGQPAETPKPQAAPAATPASAPEKPAAAPTPAAPKAAKPPATEKAAAKPAASESGAPKAGGHAETANRLTQAQKAQAKTGKTLQKAESEISLAVGLRKKVTPEQRDANKEALKAHADASRSVDAAKASHVEALKKHYATPRAPEQAAKEMLDVAGRIKDPTLTGDEVGLAAANLKALDGKQLQDLWQKLGYTTPVSHYGGKDKQIHEIRQKVLNIKGTWDRKDASRGDSDDDALRVVGRVTPAQPKQLSREGTMPDTTQRIDLSEDDIFSDIPEMQDDETEGDETPAEAVVDDEVAESAAGEDVPSEINAVAELAARQGVMVDPCADPLEFLRHLKTAWETHHATKDIEEGTGPGAGGEMGENAVVAPDLAGGMMMSMTEREAMQAEIDELKRDRDRQKRADATRLLKDHTRDIVDLRRTGRCTPPEAKQWSETLSATAMSLVSSEPDPKAMVVLALIKKSKTLREGYYFPTGAGDNWGGADMGHGATEAGGDPLNAKPGNKPDPEVMARLEPRWRPPGAADAQP